MTFDLDKVRTSLALKNPLVDVVPNNMKELKDVTFGRDFGGITDLKVGPHGCLYVVSYIKGKIFRTVPAAHNISGRLFLILLFDYV